jgi:hypothetical protein
MLHDLIFELLHYKPDKTSDHNTWFVWLPSYFIRDSLRVLKLATISVLLYADSKSMFLLCGNRSMFVRVVSSGPAFKGSHNFTEILDGISDFHHIILVV